MSVLMCSTCGIRPATIGRACRVCVERRARYRAGLPPLHNRTQRSLQLAMEAVQTINELAAPAVRVPERERCSAVAFDLNHRTRKILIAALNQPWAFGVRALTEELGQPVSTKDMAEFIVAGLMLEEEQPAAANAQPQPPRRFALTDLGREVAEDVKSYNPIPGSGVTPEILQILYERFSAGDGSDTRSQMELARTFGISIIVVVARYKEWLAGEVAAMLDPEAPPATPVPVEATENAAPVAAVAVQETIEAQATEEIPPGKILGAKRDLLFARFDAGVGFSNEAKAVLAKDFGCTPGAIARHLVEWRKERGIEPGGRWPVNMTNPSVAEPAATFADLRRRHLCETCIHARVCVLTERAEGRVDIYTQRDVTIRLGPQPIYECTAYTAEAAS